MAETSTIEIIGWVTFSVVIVLLTLYYIGINIYTKVQESDKQSFVTYSPGSKLSDLPQRQGEVPHDIAMYEANPMIEYRQKLAKTGKLYSNSGSLLNIEEQLSKIAKKQGTVTDGMLTQHSQYAEANMGSWGLPQLTRNDTREVNSSYVAGTRALRAVKIRSNENIVPDMVNNTAIPLMPLNTVVPNLS